MTVELTADLWAELKDCMTAVLSEFLKADLMAARKVVYLVGCLVSMKAVTKESTKVAMKEAPMVVTMVALTAAWWDFVSAVSKDLTMADR